MPRFGRRRLLITVSLAVLLLAPLAAYLLGRGQDLKSRLALVSVGMTREQVVGILGRPALVLHRTPPGTGDLLVWVDQLSQVDVVIGPDGKVIRFSCKRSDSLYWRTVGRLISVPE